MPLAGNNWGYKFRHTGCLEGFVKYDERIFSGAMANKPSFIQTGLSHSKFNRGGGIHRHTDSKLISYAQSRTRNLL
jgi:hypothetical protein